MLLKNMPRVKKSCSFVSYHRIFQTEEKLKEFDNRVAHFEGNLESYVIMDQPFSQGDWDIKDIRQS